MLIELSGTPGSGKSSIINCLLHSELFTNLKVIGEDNSPFDYKNSNFELRVLWSIFDTCSKVDNFLTQNNTDDLVIFNRGIFDRLAWVRLLCSKNKSYADTAQCIENWLLRHEVLLQMDTIFLFLTSYNKILERRKEYVSPSRPFWIVNPETIQELNSIYFELFNELKNSFNIVMLDDINRDITLDEKISIIKLRMSKL